MCLYVRNVFYTVIWLLSFIKFGFFEEGACDASGKPDLCESSHKYTLSQYLNKRYLLYEVNPGEGFNLRRDVYMRVARLVKKLNEDSDSDQWILVLPPWGPLYHWKSKNIGFQAQIKWSKFFDISNLAKYVPVIEFEEFLTKHGPEIDVVYYLQHYIEGWTDGKFEEKADIRDCIDPPVYSETEDRGYIGWFWGYEDVYAKQFHCLSVQGYGSTLKKVIASQSGKVIMIDRAEVILHDSFGDAEYWMVRKSMVFAKELIRMGNSFREHYLNSSDKEDKTEQPNLFPKQQRALGGPYIGVHMRRLDFVKSRSKDVPNLKHAADQIMQQMKKFNLQLVFVATDASKSEFKEFQQYIPSAVRYTPDLKTLKQILDGGVAIIDQWICAHSRYFIGTYESTFSFRIQEERELLGFPVEMTFNRLCGDNQTACKQPSRWTIVHD